MQIRIVLSIVFLRFILDVGLSKFVSAIVISVFRKIDQYFVLCFSL